MMKHFPLVTLAVLIAGFLPIGADAQVSKEVQDCINNVNKQGSTMHRSGVVAA